MPAIVRTWTPGQRVAVRSSGLGLVFRYDIAVAFEHSRNQLARPKWFGNSHCPMMQSNSAILVLSFDETQRIYSQ